ncbi:DUF3489 domain-containing protein [Humitalea sp. 24SJ18S-53]|uniref:DUF3489 domain-containing protein n=1 Tax=Humitalea sp. 24SJ18S-53 TaxID=3422307 RepID=UPI003D66A03B
MTRTTSTLTVAQMLVLTSARQRPDLMILPLPASLRARGASQHRLLTSLLTRGLVAEQPNDDPARSWRNGDQGQHHALRLTEAGIRAAGSVIAPAVPIPEEPIRQISRPPEPGQASTPPTSAQGEARPGGKLGQILDAVAAGQGATLVDLIALTGWQPHTTRAALTRLRQRGFALRLVAEGGQKAYRLASTEAI